MRSIRGSALVLAFVALTPAVALSQAERPFTDAWFWGAKAGVLSFSTSRIENGFAPSVGTDWLITRSRSALYISVDRAFFSEQSTVSNPQSLTGESVVDVRDMTRLGFALLAFPKPDNDVRWYGGAGLALSFIQEASPAAGGTASGDLWADSQIDEESSRASFQMMAGVQMAMKNMSAFGQVVMLPFENGFLLNGRAGYGLEVGLRWNIGGSIDQIK